MNPVNREDPTSGPSGDKSRRDHESEQGQDHSRDDQDTGEHNSILPRPGLSPSEDTAYWVRARIDLIRTMHVQNVACPLLADWLPVPVGEELAEEGIVNALRRVVIQSRTRIKIHCFTERSSCVYIP